MKIFLLSLLHKVYPFSIFGHPKIFYITKKNDGYGKYDYCIICDEFLCLTAKFMIGGHIPEPCATYLYTTPAGEVTRYCIGEGPNPAFDK